MASDRAEAETDFAGVAAGSQGVTPEAQQYHLQKTKCVSPMAAIAAGSYCGCGRNSKVVDLKEEDFVGEDGAGSGLLAVGEQ